MSVSIFAVILIGFLVIGAVTPGFGGGDIDGGAGGF